MEDYRLPGSRVNPKNGCQGPCSSRCRSHLCTPGHARPLNGIFSPHTA